jgi:hypothetical protein
MGENINQNPQPRSATHSIHSSIQDIVKNAAQKFGPKKAEKAKKAKEDMKKRKKEQEEAGNWVEIVRFSGIP